MAVMAVSDIRSRLKMLYESENSGIPSAEMLKKSLVFAFAATSRTEKMTSAAPKMFIGFRLRLS